MSKEFIEKYKGADELNLAYRQQRQIAHFTQSSIQEEITTQYLEEWANRNYAGSDYFLTWVKQIFKTRNFLSFYKYLRYPLPSAKLINDEIKPQLKRVYFADDSYFKYTIKGKEVETPEILKNDTFEDLLFNAILFNYNDIIVHDLDDVNSTYRELLCIKDVVSIKSEQGIIQKIAYAGKVYYNGEEVDGVVYLDSERYMFYDKDLKNVLINETHDLGNIS